MNLPHYTVELLVNSHERLCSAEFTYPIAWDANNKPVFYTKVKFPVADIHIEKQGKQYRHVLRVLSLKIPPLQPPA